MCWLEFVMSEETYRTMSSDEEEQASPHLSPDHSEEPDDVPATKKGCSSKTVASKKSKKKEESKYAWTTYATEALIKEWEVRPILFDCTNKDYHLKDKRRASVEVLLRRVIDDHKVQPAPSVDDIMKKMHNLPTYFNAERNKPCVWFPSVCESQWGTGKK